MKHITIILTLFVLTLVTFNLSCDGKTTQSPSPTTTTESSPSPESPKSRSGDLVEATSSGDIGYDLAGLDDSTRMNLKVRNKTERVWEVKIEVGTKIEPDESDVQQMVVTKEIEVHLEPHEHESLELEVSCLNISKAPPSKTNVKWHLEGSKNLNQFIRCANDAISDLKAKGEADEKNRRSLIQLALWQARGATHEEWIKFYEEYQDLSPEEAEQAIDVTEPIAKKVISRCPAL